MTEKKGTVRSAKKLKEKKVSPKKSISNKQKLKEVTPNAWLQDVSVEAPVPSAAAINKPGQRELDFSVGLRQMEGEGFVKSELRARALIHAQGAVIALVEASYVNVVPESEVPENVASILYASLRPQLGALLAMTGHTPPLPENLDRLE